MAVAVLAVGFLAGASLRLVGAKERPAPAGPAPRANVVPLKSLRFVNVERQSITLHDLAQTLQTQTGRSIKLDPWYETRPLPPPLTVLLHNATLNDTLDGVALLVNGRWERTKTGYILRHASPDDTDPDMGVCGFVVDRLAAYFQDIDPKDPSLKYGMEERLLWFREALARRDRFGAVLADPPSGWKVYTTDRSIEIVFKEKAPHDGMPPNTETSINWWWSGR